MPSAEDLRTLLSIPKLRAVAALAWWRKVDPLGYLLFQVRMQAEADRRESLRCQQRCCK